MGKNRNRIVNRQSQANGVAAATVAAQTAAQESADHLTQAVKWARKAEFGLSLAYLTCAFHITEYVRGALVSESTRTGGGGDLSKTRSAAKKIIEGRLLEALGDLPDVDLLISCYAAYNLLSDKLIPDAATSEAPWSGFRQCARLVTRAKPETEGWTFAPIVVQDKARTIFREWLLPAPGAARVKVSELKASVDGLLGLAPKAPATPAAKPTATPDNPVVTVVPVSPGEQPATLAPESTPQAPATAPNAVATPPEGQAPADNPAAPTVAAQQAQPAPTEAPEVNPNFSPGGEVEDSEDRTEDAKPTAPEDPPKSDLPRPADRKPEERKADVNAIAFDGKPENVAEQFLEVLLSYDDPKDGHAVMTALGRLLGHESMEKNTLLASLLEAYCDVSQDVDTLQGIAELTGTKADSLTDARQPTVAAVA